MTQLLICCEHFKPCRGEHRTYKNYEIGTYATIRNINNHKILNPFIDGDGYAIVKLYVNGVQYTERVHRLVLFTHRPSRNKPVVDHIVSPRIRGWPKCNALSNLRWATYRENSRNRICKAPVSLGDHFFLHGDESFITPVCGFPYTDLIMAIQKM